MRAVKGPSCDSAGPGRSAWWRVHRPASAGLTTLCLSLQLLGLQWWTGCTEDIPCLQSGTQNVSIGQQNITYSARLACVDVPPFVTFYTPYIAHLDTKGLISDLLIILAVAGTKYNVNKKSILQKQIWMIQMKRQENMYRYILHIRQTPEQKILTMRYNVVL